VVERGRTGRAREERGRKSNSPKSLKKEGVLKPSRIGKKNSDRWKHAWRSSTRRGRTVPEERRNGKTRETNLEEE